MSSCSDIIRQSISSRIKYVYQALLEIKKTHIRTPKGVERLVSGGLVHRLLELIKPTTSLDENFRSKVIDMAISVLGNMCMEECTRRQVLKEKGLRYIVELLLSAEVESLQNRTGRCLANMLLSPRSWEFDDRPAVVEKIVDLLRATTNEECILTCIRTVRLLGKTGDHVNGLVEKNAVCAVVKLIDNDSKTVAQSALRCIHSLCTHCCSIQLASQVISSGKLPVFLDLVKAYNDEAFKVVVQSAEHHNFRAAFGNAGGITVFHKLLRKGKKFKTLRKDTDQDGTEKIQISEKSEELVTEFSSVDRKESGIAENIPSLPAHADLGQGNVQDNIRSSNDIGTRSSGLDDKSKMKVEKNNQQKPEININEEQTKKAQQKPERKLKQQTKKATELEQGIKEGQSDGFQVTQDGKGDENVFQETQGKGNVSESRGECNEVNNDEDLLDENVSDTEETDVDVIRKLQAWVPDLLSVLCLSCKESVNRIKLRDERVLVTLLQAVKDPEVEMVHARIVSAFLCFLYDEPGFKILLSNGLVPVLVKMLNKIVGVESTEDPNKDWLATAIENEECLKSIETLRDSESIRTLCGSKSTSTQNEMITKSKHEIVTDSEVMNKVEAKVDHSLMSATKEANVDSETDDANKLAVFTLTNIEENQNRSAVTVDDRCSEQKAVGASSETTENARNDNIKFQSLTRKENEVQVSENKDETIENVSNLNKEETVQDLDDIDDGSMIDRSVQESSNNVSILSKEENVQENEAEDDSGMLDSQIPDSTDNSKRSKPVYSIDSPTYVPQTDWPDKDTGGATCIEKFTPPHTIDWNTYSPLSAMSYYSPGESSPEYSSEYSPEKQGATSPASCSGYSPVSSSAYPTRYTNQPPMYTGPQCQLYRSNESPTSSPDGASTSSRLGNRNARWSFSSSDDSDGNEVDVGATGRKLFCDTEMCENLNQTQPFEYSPVVSPTLNPMEDELVNRIVEKSDRDYENDRMNRSNKGEAQKCDGDTEAKTNRANNSAEMEGCEGRVAESIANTGAEMDENEGKATESSENISMEVEEDAKTQPEYGEEDLIAIAEAQENYNIDVNKVREEAEGNDNIDYSRVIEEAFGMADETNESMNDNALETEYPREKVQENDDIDYSRLIEEAFGIADETNENMNNSALESDGTRTIEGFVPVAPDFSIFNCDITTSSEKQRIRTRIALNHHRSRRKRNKSSSSHCYVLENNILHLLSKVSQMDNPSKYLVTKDALTCLLDYISNQASPLARCPRLLSRVFRNPLCFPGLLILNAPILVYRNLLENENIQELAKCLKRPERRRSSAMYRAGSSSSLVEEVTECDRFSVGDATPGQETVRSPPSKRPRSGSEAEIKARTYKGVYHTQKEDVCDAGRSGLALLDDLSSLVYGWVDRLMFTLPHKQQTKLCINLLYITWSHESRQHYFGQREVWSKILAVLQGTDDTNMTSNLCQSTITGLRFLTKIINHRNPQRRDSDVEHTSSPFTTESVTMETCLVTESPITDSDVVIFVVDGQKVSVSKTKLVKKSDIFAAMLEGQYSEASLSEIPIRDTSLTTFQYLIHYLHGCSSSNCPIIREFHTQEATPDTTSLVLELVSEADKFLIFPLKEMAYKLLCDRFIIPESAMLVFKHAMIHRRPDLLKMTVQSVLVDSTDSIECAIHCRQFLQSKYADIFLDTLHEVILD